MIQIAEFGGDGAALSSSVVREDLCGWQLLLGNTFQFDAKC